jgi:YD repeat-containing protein
MRFVRRIIVGCLLLLPLTLVAQSVKYSYDELGRLAGVVDQNGNAAQYIYDANGNILSIDRYAATDVAILSFEPSTGAIGQTVTISGINFAANAIQDLVSFNGASASVVSATTNQIVVSVPLGATTGAIAVTAPLGTATTSHAFTVDNSQGPPSIADFTPTVAAAGSSVTLTGTGFGVPSSNDLVGIGGRPAPIQSGATAAQLTFAVPLETGSGHVTLLTPQGLATSSADLFIPPPPYLASQVSVSQRIAIDSSTSVSIPTAGNIGMLIFNGTAGQQINLQVSSSTFAGCYTLSILTPAGSQTAYTVQCGAGGFSEIALAPTTGTYTALLAPLGGSTGSAIVTLSTDQVGSITANASVPVTTSLPGQNVRLAFNGTAGQQINLQVSSPTFAGCYTLSILTPAGSQAAYTIQCGAGGFSEITLATTGTYTALLAPLSGGTGSAIVTLSTDQVGSITGNTSVPVTTSLPGQNVRLAFSGTAGQQINLQVSSSTFAGCYTLSILAPDGSQAASTVQCGAGGFSEITLATTGTYIALLAPGGGSTGSAIVTLSSDQVGSITANTSVPVNISLPGQNVRLAFSGTAGQQINLQVSGWTFAGCDTLSILNPDGTQAASAAQCGAGGFSEITLATTGTYIALLAPAGYTGSATVTLSTDQVGSITANTSVPVNISLPGQNVRLAFSGTAGQLINLQVSSPTFAACYTLSILNPDGTQGGSTVQCRAGGFSEITLPTTGNYIALLAPAGYTGSATVTLSTDQVGSITANTSVPVNISLPGQNVRLAFSGTAGQQINLQVSSPTFAACYTLSILNPDGTQAASAAPCGAGGFSEITLATTGTYTALLAPAGYTGSATVTLSTE